MEPALRQHFRSFRICIAISAQMSASVICADIAGQIAGAIRSCAFLFGRVQMLSDGFFIIADPHTAAAVGAVGSKFIAFRAGLYCHAVGRSNLYDLFSKNEALFPGDLFSLREVPSDLRIEVNETDHGSSGIAVEGSCYFVKSTELVFHCVPIREQDRVEAPADRIYTDHVGEPLEVVDQAVLVRDIRLNVSSVRRDGDEPVLAVVLQKIHIGEHGSRIFGAEADDVHNRRVKAVAADLTRIKGIANADKPFS